MLKTLNKIPKTLEAYIFLNRQTIPNVFIISRWNPLYSQKSNVLEFAGCIGKCCQWTGVWKTSHMKTKSEQKDPFRS